MLIKYYQHSLRVSHYVRRIGKISVVNVSVDQIRIVENRVEISSVIRPHKSKHC